MALSAHERLTRAITSIGDEIATQYLRKKARPEADRSKIKQEIEAYLRSPSGSWPKIEWRMRSGEYGSYTKEHAAAANRLAKALVKLDKVLRDKNLPDTLRHPISIDSKNKLQLTVYQYEYLEYIAEDWQRRARAGQRVWRRWPKDPDARTKANAAQVAVRLFDHHQLKCTASKTATNKLIQLAAIIFGQQLRTKSDQGWYHYCNDAINAALAKNAMKHTTREATGTAQVK